MRDYEQLYYDLYFRYRNLIKENKELKQEIDLLKKYTKNGDLKEIIIKEILRHKEHDIK